MKNKIMNGIIVLELLILVGLGVYIFVDVESDKKMDDVENDKEYINLKDYDKKEIGDVYKIEKDGLVYITDKKGKIKEIGTDIFIYGEDFPGYYAIKKQKEDVYTLYYSNDFITNNQEGNTYKGKNSDKYVYFPLENENNSIYTFLLEDACCGRNTISSNYYFENSKNIVLWNSLNGKIQLLDLDDKIDGICNNGDNKYIAIHSQSKDGSIIYDDETLEQSFEYKVNTFTYRFNQAFDNEKYFSFCKKNKCGVGDANENLIIPLEYTSTFVLKNDLILASTGNITLRNEDLNIHATGPSGMKGGIVDRTKSDGELFGILNLKNEIVIPFVYEYLEIFDLDNYIIAKKDGKYGVINYKNEIIVDFELETLPNTFKMYLFSENYLYIDGTIYDLITKEKLIEDVKKYDFTENYLVYSKEGKITIYSTNEHKVIVDSLNGISPYSSMRSRKYSYSKKISYDNTTTCHCMINETEKGLIIPYNDNKGAYLLNKEGNIEVLLDYKCCG